MNEGAAPLPAKELFEALVKAHVEVPLNLPGYVVKIARNVAPDAHGPLETLSGNEAWRPFMPPLHNFLVTCIEVFLECHFLERYVRPDGTHYVDADEWMDDIAEFRKRHTWTLPPETKAPAIISRGFSFQRLSAVDVLYAGALGRPLNGYPHFHLIKCMFQKRHLFTHRGGIIDRKFLDGGCEGAYEAKLDASAIGKHAFIEPAWMRDSVHVARAFVTYLSAP